MTTKGLTGAELRRVMDEHLDYDEYEFADGEWGPEVYCPACHAAWPSLWSDFEDDERLRADNAWRVAAEHWIREHGSD